MKKIVFSLVLVSTLMVTGCASFKDKGLNDYYSLYEKKVDKIKIPGFLMNVLSGKEELKPVLKHIQSAEMITVTDATKKMKKNLDSAIKYDKLDKLVNFNLGNDPISVYGIEENEHVKHILFRIDNNSEIRLIDAKVNIPVTEFEKILSKL